NLALLVRWLHLDVELGAEHRTFLRRVTTAWNDVKTPERRAAYDLARRGNDNKPKRFPKHRARPRFRKISNGWHRLEQSSFIASHRRMAAVLRRALLFLLARA